MSDGIADRIARLILNIKRSGSVNLSRCPLAA
jgi:hypothetical protein